MLSGPSTGRISPYAHGRRSSSLSRIRRLMATLLGRPLHLLLSKVPLPLILLVVLQWLWILFDQHVTSQIPFAAPRPYVPPTEHGPLSPFYSGPPYEDYNGPVRAFPPKSFPCHHLSTESRFSQVGTVLKSGFLFLMQQQVASTTLASVSSRIARNVAQRTRKDALTLKNQTACATWTAPVKAKRLKVRIKDQSFLWTMVREPVDRLVSKFFHLQVSIDGKEPTLENFQKYLEAGAYLEYGNYFKQMSMRRHINPGRMDLMPTLIQELLESYDFVGVMERFDESLAVLQLLLGLETEDMLYIPTRTGSSNKNRQNTGGASFHPLPLKIPSNIGEEIKCVALQSAQNHVTLKWKEYLHQTYMFDEVFEPDVYLYKAMNASLDATISALGKERVEVATRQLVWTQQRVKAECAPNAIFPCSAQGQIQKTADCFSSDVGCGSECLDRLGKTLATDVDFPGK